MPEDWGHIPKGYFDTKGEIPEFKDSRFKFCKGLFQDTLPTFILSNSDILCKRLLVNFDADLYSSTLYTLIQLSDFLKPNDILIFDEFFSVMNASTEFRAFLDFRAITSLNFEVIAKTSTHCGMIII